MSNVIKYDPRWYKSIELTLGDEVSVSRVFFRGRSRENCRFVKVTRKGFNILDLDTNRMIFKKHLYSRKMVGKEYPRTGTFKVKVQVPTYIDIELKQERKMG